MIDIDEFIQNSNAIENIHNEPDSSPFVVGQREAIEYVESGIPAVTLPEILDIHRLIMRGTGLEKKYVGQLRDCDVWIGGRKAVSPVKIRPMLLDLVRKMNRENMDPREAHYEFEYIHPFADGNGRTGRILWMLHEIIAYGEPQSMVKYDERYEYYAELAAYSMKRRQDEQSDSNRATKDRVY